MQTINEIESAVKKLSKKDFFKFRNWFYEYEAKAWDAQLDSDVKNGILDDLASKAISDFQSGKCKNI